MYQTVIVAEGKKTPKFIVSLNEEVVEQTVQVGKVEFYVKTPLTEVKRELRLALSEKGVTLVPDASIEDICDAIKAL